jgi:flagella synthesis protein FlgN
LLAEEQRLLDEFIAAIGAERSALDATDTADLVAATERKSALATRLAAIEHSRDEALRSAGHAAGRTGMEAWLALPANAGARPAWQALLAAAARARDANDANGKLLALRLQHNRQALDVLLGESAGGSTYGADGQVAGSGTGRRLGSA